MESKIRITPFEDGIIIAISGDLDSLRVMSYRSLIQSEMNNMGLSFSYGIFRI